MDSKKSNYTSLKSQHSQSQTFKLLFWNILCDKYSSNWKTAPRLEIKYKQWNYRFKLFQSILSNPSTISDLYCFVEVDKQNELCSIINSNNNQSNTYAFIYYPRPNTPLGISLIYNKAKFAMVNSYQYFLTDDPNLNFALCACLKEINEGYTITVIITHLIAWEKYEDKRVDQVNTLLKCIKKDNYKCDKIVICGDFNANPDSPSVKMMREKYCSINDLDDKDLHTIVIDTFDEGIKTLHFDYVFYEGKELKVLEKNLPKELLDYEKGIPNEEFPSDHLYLQCQFEVIN